MEQHDQQPLATYLERRYPFIALADPEGGYVVTFPDLPGCMTQVESEAEVGGMAEEARRLWIESAFEGGLAIPPPSYHEEHSGRFNLRLPKSLHRELVEAAEREGVSLNQYVVSLLARRHAEARVERRLAEIEQRLAGVERPNRRARATG